MRISLRTFGFLPGRLFAPGLADTFNRSVDADLAVLLRVSCDASCALLKCLLELRGQK
jgi:hypothetical protein